MKRIENFRKGDRAEKLGVWLLQAFCAVAEVPRQEDFGLMDAVATLLRRDHGCLYAEDSFLVQVKSRTESQIEYFGMKFDALLSQDLPLMVAHVDLTRTSAELHTLGIALAHPNINDAKRLVADLQPDESSILGLVDDVLHVPLRKPILRWTAGDIESRTFRDQAYTVLKAWVNIERWNRRYRRAGVLRQVCWETNEVPTDGYESITWNPSRSRDALDEVTPIVRLLAFHATDYPALRAPTRAIFSWLREHGTEADPTGMHGFLLRSCDFQDRLKRALDDEPRADVAFTFWVEEVRDDFLAFWLFGRDKDGTASGIRHTGSPQSLYHEGFEARIEIVGIEATVTIGLSEGWLRKHNLVEAIATTLETSTHKQSPTQVILLQRPSESSAA